MQIPNINRNVLFDILNEISFTYNYTKKAQRVTVFVRVMNPLKETQSVYQDTVLGTTGVCFKILG